MTGSRLTRKAATKSEAQSSVQVDEICCVAHRMARGKNPANCRSVMSVVCYRAPPCVERIRRTMQNQLSV
jgi:hypothetical protein